MNTKSAIVVGLILWACLLACISPVIYKTIQLEYYRHKWNQHEIKNYRITIEHFGPGGASSELQICDGQMTILYDPEGGFCRHYSELCAGDPVDELFKLAGDNLWPPINHRTEYNTQYGFPDEVTVFFIEGDGVIVKDFQELDSCEEQPLETAP